MYKSSKDYIPTISGVVTTLALKVLAILLSTLLFQITLITEHTYKDFSRFRPPYVSYFFYSNRFPLNNIKHNLLWTF